VRTLLSVIAISLQVTMVLTLVGLGDGMMQEQARRARGVGADIIIRPPSGSVINFSGNMPERLIPVVIQPEPHVTVASGVLVHGTDMFNYVTGVDLKTFDLLNGGFHFVSGGPFRGPDDVMVDSYYAQQHNLNVGDSVTVLNRPWRVTGIYETGMLARQVFPLAKLQDLTANTGKITIIYVKLDDPARTADIIADLKQKLKGYEIRSMDEYTELFSVNSVPMLRQFIWVVIGIGVLIGFLVVFLSMYTAVLERTREIGVLKALGASPAYVLNILLRETVVLAIAGAIFGIAMSYGTRYIISNVVHGSLIQAIAYDWWPITTALALGGAMLGALYPGLKAARQDAIEALSYE